FILAFSLWFRPPKWAAAARSIIFYPAILSGVIISITWSRLLALDGPVNGVAGSITGSPVDVLWLADLKLTFWVLVFVEIWRAAGVSMVLYLAGMGRISSE